MEEEEDRYTRITLRIPKDLHALLSDQADVASRSLNAEIIGRLQSTFSQQRSLFSEAELKALATDLATEITRRVSTTGRAALEQSMDEAGIVDMGERGAIQHAPGAGKAAPPAEPGETRLVRGRASKNKPTVRRG